MEEEPIFDPGISSPPATDQPQNLPTKQNELERSPSKGRRRSSLGGQNPICTQSICHEDNDVNMFQCNSCKRMVHYRCTSLPLYQIQHFLTKKYRNVYVCSTCTPIPDYLNNIFPKPPELTQDNVVHDLKKVIADKQKEVDVLAETNRLLNAKIVELSNAVAKIEKVNNNQGRTNNNLKSEIDKLTKQLMDTNQHLSEKATKIYVLENNEHTLQSILEEREETLQETQNKLHVIEQQTQSDEEKDREMIQLKDKINRLENNEFTLNNRLKAQGKVISNMKKKREHSLTDTTNDIIVSEKQLTGDVIDSKLEAFSVAILAKVTDVMEKKFETLNTKNQQTAQEGTTKPPNAWSTVASQPRDMKAIMRDARNDEKLEESEKQKRARNIIIHGAEEVGESPEVVKKEDEGYIKEILAKIGVEATPATIMRLGEAKKENETRHRPIKIVMKSKEDKDKVMKNLGRLKGTERYFGKISVKDDYTSNEREQIRMLTQQATKQTEESLDRTYKVRGDSKNGWHIMSFPKK